MNAVEIIRKKRDGTSLSRQELTFLLEGYVQGDLPDYQMTAFLMACFFRGMDDAESIDFTDLMLHSGIILDLSDIPGRKVDKHSTGGVADTVSLLLAPIVASCGVIVPMISGRGLGHTGGTLDKLESIPGFRTDLDLAQFRRILKENGVSMIGQTDDIAPADKKLYALRDVTATIECPPLIAGSIMSKKLASGIDALVLDIKTGNGAFMRDADRAADLGQRLVSIGEQAGKRTIAYLTDMNQPLGCRIGNWFEVEETMRCLRGEEDAMNADLLAVTHLLGGTMLFLGGVSPSVEDGIRRSRSSVQDGSALRTFELLVEAQGGDPEALRGSGPYAPAQYSRTIPAESDGFLQDVETHTLGMCSVLLGAGRLTLTDRPDPMAGIVVSKRKGMAVLKGDVLATIYTNDEGRIASVADRLGSIFSIGAHPPTPELPVKATIDTGGIRPWTSADSPVYPS